VSEITYDCAAYCACCGSSFVLTPAIYIGRIWFIGWIDSNRFILETSWVWFGHFT